MSGQSRILVGDDEESLRLVLRTALTKAGYIVDTVDDGLAAVKQVQEVEYDVVILDVRMPKMDGLNAFREIHQLSPDLPVILMTAFGSAEITVEAMKRGAFDYLTKPFNINEVKILIERAIHIRKLTQDLEYLTEQVRTLSRVTAGPGQLIGRSPKIQDVYKSIGRVAASKATVLLTGESGTGKGMVARTIHYNSDRWQKPFIQVNCGAIPEGLLESELFGHERGAFTGAITQRPGKFELAEGGTLFLDEIAELGPALEVKLLRVLQEREFERVGGIKTFKTDVRIIAATNRDLPKEVEEKRFRSDLYYRLNVVSIHLPPLRERDDDIALLADYLLSRYAIEIGRQGVVFIPEVYTVLSRYSWPGNVRELENAIEHALIMSNSKIILPEHLPLEISKEDVGKPATLPATECTTFTPLREALAETEKRHIAEALRLTHENRVHAARLLQISRRGLLYKIQEYGLA